MWEAYKGVGVNVGRYWRGYGGLVALLQSPFFHASLVITTLLFPYWSSPRWWETVIAIMPNLIGFSLGGYAIWLGLGDDSFRKLLSGRAEQEAADEPSPFMQVNAAFVHFIIMQVAGLFAAIFAMAYYFPLSHDSVLWKVAKFLHINLVETLYIGRLIYWGFAFWIFIYALLMAVAATLTILRVAHWFEKYKDAISSDTSKQ